MPDHARQLDAFDSPFLAVSAPRLSAPEWVERHRIVVDSAMSGPWDWRHGFMSREPLAAASDPYVDLVALCGPAQLVKTEFAINLALWVSWYGDRVLLYEPDQDLAKKIIGDRIRPSMQALGSTSVIGLDDKLRKRKDSTIEIRYGGGGAILALSPMMKTGLASHAALCVVFDEIDKMGRSDLLVGARSRTTTYGADAIVAVCSTPTIDAPGRIWRIWQEGSAGVWHGRCPHCGELAGMDFGRVQFDSDSEGHWIPGTAAVVCSHCAVRWTEMDRIAAVRGGCYVHERPDFHERTFRIPGCAHIWKSLQSIVAEGAKARRVMVEEHDPAPYALWRNERLAETWDEFETGLSASGLSSTTYSLGARGERDMGGLDPRVTVITVGADIGARSIHAEFIGWGLDPETDRVRSWGLRYLELGGDPEDDIDKPDLWSDFDAEIRRSVWRRPDGRGMAAARVMVDIGYRPEVVLDWIRHRYRGEAPRQPEPYGAQVLPIRGHHLERDVYPINLTIGAKKRKNRALLVPCVVYAETQGLKGSLYDWKVADRRLPAGAERAHQYPEGGVLHGYTEAYFREMSAERKDPYRTPQGRPATRWVKRHGWVRGEAWDCRVYALAGLYVMAYPRPLTEFLQRRAAKRGPGAVVPIR